MPVCPVDCIALENACGARTGWDAWSPMQAAQARERYEIHSDRGRKDEGNSLISFEKMAVMAQDSELQPTRSPDGPAGEQAAITGAAADRAAREVPVASAAPLANPALPASASPHEVPDKPPGYAPDSTQDDARRAAVAAALARARALRQPPSPPAKPSA